MNANLNLPDFSAALWWRSLELFSGCLALKLSLFFLALAYQNCGEIFVFYMFVFVSDEDNCDIGAVVRQRIKYLRQKKLKKKIK